MPLSPIEARAFDSARQLVSAVRQSGVRLLTDRGEDGSVSLTLRGNTSAVEDAVERIEAALHGDGLCPVEEGRRIRSLASGGVLVPRDAATLRMEFELFAAEHSAALAAGGSKWLESVCEDTGATLQIQPPLDAPRAALPLPPSAAPRRVVITGEEASCLAARERLHATLRSAAANPPPKSDGGALTVERGDGGALTLVIPRHLVGRLIGTRGATIKDLREATGAQLEMAKAPDGVGRLSLSGTPAAVRAARERIEALVQEDAPPQDGLATPARVIDESIVLSVPANRVGKVIGARGSIIQKLRVQTGATIDLQKDGTGAATVKLRGSLETMRAAHEVIRQIVYAPEDARVL